MIAVLHTWSQTLVHHPHLHCIVPGGGLTPDDRWRACRPGFFLSVRVLSRLYRRLFLERLQVPATAAHFASSETSPTSLSRRRSPHICVRCAVSVPRAPAGVGLSRPLHAPDRDR